MKELKNIITSRLSYIPDYINTTSSTHHIIWLNVCDINCELLKLISNSILNEKSVFKVFTNVNTLIDVLDEITDNDMKVKLLVHFSKTLLYLEQITIDNEAYEATANIKKFNDLYYNINIIE